MGSEEIALKTSVVHDLERTKQVLERYQEEITNYPGVVGCRTGETNYGSLCLVVYVSVDPKKSVAAALLPPHFEGVPVLIKYSGNTTAAGAR